MISAITTYAYQVARTSTNMMSIMLITLRVLEQELVMIKCHDIVDELHNCSKLLSCWRPLYVVQRKRIDTEVKVIFQSALFKANYFTLQ